MHKAHDEDVEDDMEKRIEEQTRELMTTTLQKETSQKGHDANALQQSYLHHTFMTISKICNSNNTKNNDNVSIKKLDFEFIDNNMGINTGQIQYCCRHSTP
jgi:hypothetical protein